MGIKALQQHCFLCGQAAEPQGRNHWGSVYISQNLELPLLSWLGLRDPILTFRHLLITPAPALALPQAAGDQQLPLDLPPPLHESSFV